MKDEQKINEENCLPVEIYARAQQQYDFRCLSRVKLTITPVVRSGKFNDNRS
jgi:hypothetical protein